MDDIDLKIIGLLAMDAKRSLTDIGGSVGLSPSSVNERIRRLTASGAIRQFTVDLDPAAMGAQTLVFVWIACVRMRMKPLFGTTPHAIR